MPIVSLALKNLFHVLFFIETQVYRFKALNTSTGRHHGAVAVDHRANILPENRNYSEN
ncbi:MAG: hypothetical protein HGJ94_07420 [Desulfosarcina sp.]|nr:hypothetical protein [Desulfosarcina sp.]